MTAGGRRAIPLLGAILAVSYALAAFHTAAQAQHAPWSVAVAIGPLTFAALVLAYQTLGRWRFIPVLLLVAATLIITWPVLQQHLAWAYFIQHLGLMLCGALAFGLSLAHGRTPLCTVFAGYAHDALTPALLTYTRRITLAWTLFFVAMAIISAALFFSPLPLAVWSAFDTLLTLPLVALMFVAEFLVRRRLLPQAAEGGVGMAYRAYAAWRADRAAKTS